MKQKMYIIKNAAIKDMKEIFELSNDELVRQNSINQEKILWNNHIKWFHKRITLNNPFYVIRALNDKLIGQVRIDKKDEAVISISITHEFRGKNLAAKIIKDCSVKSNLSPIYAYIKPDNIASQRAFKKAGYIYNSTADNLLKFRFTLPN